MKFSIYSELQSWPGKSESQLYGEVLEQIENADRLGYDAYAAVEHLFFPKFSASANVFGLFGMAAARTSQIKFRSMLHILPYHNPLVLAAMIHQFSLMTNGRYEFGVGRGHGWIPLPAGLPLDETSRPALRGGARPLHRGAAQRHGHLPRRLLERRREPHRPVQRPRVPGHPRRHLRQDVRPRREARLGRRRSAAAPVRGAQGPARPLPLEVRRLRHDARHRLDPRLLHRRRPRAREARGREAHARLPRRQRLAAHRLHAAARRQAGRGRVRLLRVRDHGEARRDARTTR